jgi:hypothetical protein
MMKYFVAILVLAAGTLGGLVWAAWLPGNTARVTIVNQSHETIIDGSIGIANNKTVNLPILDHNASFVVHFDIRADSHYDISITFDSGRVMKRDVGYLTHGFDFDDRLVVTDQDISYQSETGSLYVYRKE